MRAIATSVLALFAAGAACSETAREDEPMNEDDKKKASERQEERDLEMPPKAPGAGPGEERIDRGAIGRYGKDGRYWVALPRSIREEGGVLQTKVWVGDDVKDEKRELTVREGDLIELGDRTLRVVRLVATDDESYMVVAPAGGS